MRFNQLFSNLHNKVEDPSVTRGPFARRIEKHLHGTGSFRLTDDEEKRPDFSEKEDPSVKNKRYQELERTLEKMDELQKINYLKKRLTNHICSIYIENHPELGLIADENPRMVSEIQRRIHRVMKILDDSPLYSPFLRGINTDNYYEAGWSKRFKKAQPYVEEIKILTQKVDGKLVEKEPAIPEIKISDLIYENENKKEPALLPEVYILRGLYYLMKIQKVESLRFAGDQDLSKLRANHGNYRYALRHIAKGIYSGGFSLFSVTVFGSTFDKYIQNYRTWLALEMGAMEFSGRLEVERLRSRVNRHVATLKIIRRNNKNIPLLKRMSPWFPEYYRFERIKISDIRNAVKNHENRRHNGKVHGVVTRQMIALYFNLLTFMAGSPLMRLALILLKEIKSSDVDIILQKRMIQSTQMLNNFNRMLGLGIDSKKGLENSYKLLECLSAYCNESIERYVLKKGGALERVYQRDPFVKKYMAINSFLQSYPEDKTVRKMLHDFEIQADKLLKASVKSNHIKIANTILHNIRASKRRHREIGDPRYN